MWAIPILLTVLYGAAMFAAGWITAHEDIDEDEPGKPYSYPESEK